MVPAEFMTTAVAMFTDALPEFPYFGKKLLTCHLFKAVSIASFRHNNAFSGSFLASR